MENNRIIKLLLPNNNIMKIQLGGNEEEIKDLISTITDLSPYEIKGIKDSNGNYYTFSSLLKSKTEASFDIDEESIIYELIWNKDKKDYINKSSSREKVKPRIVFASSSNVGNYYANYYIKDNNNNNSNNIQSGYFPHKKDKNEIYHFNLRKLLDNKQIDYVQYSKLVNMLNDKNDELLSKLDLYYSNKIDSDTFVKNLWMLCRKNHPIKIMSSCNISGLYNDIRNDPHVKINQRNLDEVASMIDKCFSDADGYILKEMIKLENESIIEAIRQYKIEGNFTKMIREFNNCVHNYKVKSKSFRTKPKSSTNLRCKKNSGIIYSNKNLNTTKIKGRNIDDLNILIQTGEDITRNSNDENSNMSFIKKIKENINRKSSSVNKAVNSAHHKGNEKKISMKAHSPILKYLNDINKIIFKYFKHNNHSALGILKEFLKSNETENNNIESDINEKCFELFSNEIIEFSTNQSKKISKEHIDYIFVLIQNKHDKIIKAFNNFNIHLSLEKIVNDLVNIIKISDNSSSSSSSKEEDNNDLAEEKKEKIIPLIKEKYKGKVKFIVKKRNNDNVFGHPKKKRTSKTFEIKDKGEVKKQNNINIITDKNKTPKVVNKSKKEILFFLQKNQGQSQIEKKVKDKQKEMISFLYKNKYIDKGVNEIIKRKIEENNSVLFAAFEVYAITKDNIDFIETINIIASLSGEL